MLDIGLHTFSASFSLSVPTPLFSPSFLRCGLVHRLCCATKWMCPTGDSDRRARRSTSCAPFCEQRMTSGLASSPLFRMPRSPWYFVTLIWCRTETARGGSKGGFRGMTGLNSLASRTRSETGLRVSALGRRRSDLRRSGSVSTMVGSGLMLGMSDDFFIGLCLVFGVSCSAAKIWTWICFWSSAGKSSSLESESESDSLSSWSGCSSSSPLIVSMTSSIVGVDG